VSKDGVSHYLYREAKAQIKDWERMADELMSSLESIAAPIYGEHEGYYIDDVKAKYKMLKDRDAGS
jgi:hypothetical protein